MKDAVRAVRTAWAGETGAIFTLGKPGLTSSEHQGAGLGGKLRIICDSQRKRLKIKQAENIFCFIVGMFI